MFESGGYTAEDDLNLLLDDHVVPTMVDEPDGPASYSSVLRNPNMQTLALSRAFSAMAITTVSFGSMVHLARLDVSQLQIAMLSASSYVASILFGFQGGTAADTISKRFAIAGGHFLLAALCFILPTFLGTNFGSLMFMVFVAALIMQIVGPGLNAATALVANQRELATASALVSVIGSIGSGIGSAFLAPALIKLWNIDVVIYVAGIVFLLGAVRALKLPEEPGAPSWQRFREINWVPQSLSLPRLAGMIVENRGVGTMILLGAIAVSLFEAFNTLLPLYVANVLLTDPVNAVYIFAPAGLGLVLGMFLAPKMIFRFGERKLAAVSMLIMISCMMLFGIIDVVAPFLAPISPLRIVELFGIYPNNRILAASMISLPLNFGSTACGASVTNFINRVVPVSQQGSIFGLQDVQRNLLSLISVLGLGLIASWVGPQVVMIIAPVVVGALVLWMLRYSYRTIADVHMSRREAWNMLRNNEGDATPEPAVVDEG